VLVASLNANAPKFPQEAIDYIKYLLEGKLDPPKSFWNDFE